jgi:curli production assembly/transport component CsgF
LVSDGILTDQSSLLQFDKDIVMGKVSVAAALTLGIALAASASATEQVYHPVSPTFGGNPLNGSFLLSTAQAQGNGVKSGQQGPDLSGLTNALQGVGSGGSGSSSSTPIVILGNGTSGIPTTP